MYDQRPSGISEDINGWKVDSIEESQMFFNDVLKV